jgi:RNA polymerase sigma-70 factor (ECF subfamily)
MTAEIAADTDDRNASAAPSSPAAGMPDIQTPDIQPLDIRTLVQQHHGDVYRYAYRLAGREVDAEDLTQQTFLIAQQRLHQIRQPQRVVSWLFTILRSCYLKAQGKSVPLSATSIELDVDSIPDSPIEETVDKEAIQAAINSLPDEFKLVVVMFYFEQHSYKEIAEQLQIPIGTVMSRLTRAKGRLRACLLETPHIQEAHIQEAHVQEAHVQEGLRGITS